MAFLDKNPSDFGASGARLGNTAKSVGHSVLSGGTKPAKPWQSSRMERFRHQRHAAKLLDWKERVGLCKHCVTSVSDGVQVRMTSYGEGNEEVKRASFQGLQTCGSVWHCPVCAARISKTRRKEMNDLLAWARAEGHAPFLITLTARHGIDDSLPVLLDQIKRAKQRFHQHRSWKNLKQHIVGHVTATEVTGGGRNGWHPHYHILLVVRDQNDTEENMELVRTLTGLDAPWLASLRGVGLDGGGAAFDIQDATGAGKYVAKWGAAEEMSLTKAKKGRGENRTPQQLLAASCDDNEVRAGVLWAEYAKTFKGRRQLTWSRGLKALAGIGEVSDEEAAANEVQEDQQDQGVVADIGSETWNGGARRRRGMILNGAEDQGAAGVAVAVAAEGEDPRPQDTELIEPSELPSRMQQMHDFNSLLDTVACESTFLPPKVAAEAEKATTTLAERDGELIAVKEEIASLKRLNEEKAAINLAPAGSLSMTKL